mgnify:CR=1 FL=1
MKVKDNKIVKLNDELEKFRRAFNEIQEDFENYWQNKTIGKGKGWKPFKRREAFMEPRVFPSGFFPYEKLYIEYKKLIIHISIGILPVAILTGKSTK